MLFADIAITFQGDLISVTLLTHKKAENLKFLPHKLTNSLTLTITKDPLSMFRLLCNIHYCRCYYLSFLLLLEKSLSLLRLQSVS
jgi:hypothetical protein